MQPYRSVLLLGLGWLVLGLAVTGAQAGTWTAAAEPEFSDPAWGFTGDLYDRTFVQDEYLRMDTQQEGANGYHVFDIIDQPAVMDWSVPNAVEFRMRVESVKEGANRAASMAVYSPTDDSHGDLYVTRLGAGRVGMNSSKGDENIVWYEDIDTSQWHNYIMAINPTTKSSRLFVDGVKVVEIEALDYNIPLGWNGMRWGDQGGPAEGISDWSLVAWGEDVEIPQDRIPGDANEDGKVTDADAAILATNWQKMGDATWGDGDFSNDGNVTDADAAILATHWQEGVTGEAAAVPEPTALVLLAGALLSLLVWRRR